jgi:predicted Zn finger-like uncharacterized protein
MFTQCPQCHTVFRVSATMLKAAQGRVRCGRCAHVFNALTFLIEADDAAAGAGGGAAAGAQPPAAPRDAPPKGQADEPAVPQEGAADATDEAIEELEELVEEIELDSGDIPESALEFTANDLSKVFVLEEAPIIPRRLAEPDSDDETAEHEILDIELVGPADDGAADDAAADEASADNDPAERADAETLEADQTAGAESAELAVESITLEGDSVVLEEEDLSVSGVYFTADGPDAEDQAQDRRAAPSDTPSHPERRSGADRRKVPEDTSDLSFGSVAKQPGRTTKEIDEEVQREIEAAFAADPSTRAEFTLPSGRRLEIGGTQERAEAAPFDEVEPHATLHEQQRQQRRVTLAWAGASAFLALTLVLQLLHHNRQSLARNAAIGPAMTSVYSVFGSELTPEWNVSAYELRQFGAAADADAQGTLRVRASLLNGAVHAQPYPVLRLTLQDRFGGQVGLRDLQPREYLHAAPSRNALIGAGQRIDADIAIVDPGKDAVGFEIDVCLPAATRGLNCANDAAPNSG